MRMAKITKKLIKYFMMIITSVVIVLFILSSVFVSRVYTNLQYSNLKESGKNVYSELNKHNGSTNINLDMIDTAVTVILYKNNSSNLISSHGMGKMNMLMMMDFSKLGQKGSFNNPMGEEFLYYKLNTKFGDIIILQNNKFSSKYIHVIYLVLLIVFFLGILISVPMIAYLGRQFTNPILKLQKAAFDIANGKSNLDIDINTRDEIEDLSKSIAYMADSLNKKHELQKNFVANVSHDFKTPLSVIRNYSEAIYDGILDKDETKNYSKEIIAEVDRLNNLVMKLLELSKLQNHGAVLRKENVDIKKFINDCAEKLKGVALKKNIQISVEWIGIEDNTTVQFDSVQINRVVYNFIDNAIKFSNENSKIVVRGELINKSIRISIKDYGIGIEENMLNEVWDRYYKHAKSGGMGLGLAICSEILKMHDFEYGVKSTKGEGTTFYFEVPII